MSLRGENSQPPPVVAKGTRLPACLVQTRLDSTIAPCHRSVTHPGEGYIPALSLFIPPVVESGVTLCVSSIGIYIYIP